MAGLSYATFWEHETSRMLFEGARNTDIIKVLKSTIVEEDWCLNWRKCAESELEKAVTIKEGAEGKPTKKQSLYMHYYDAANYFRLAQYHINSESSMKRELLKMSIDTYRNAIEYAPYRIENVSFNYENTNIKGYLHIPEINGPMPCIIVVPGLGHNKESMHNWCKYAVNRGIAVLACDGPGYGQARNLDNVKLKINEFPKYISTAIDYIYSQDMISVTNVGILGDCFGGYLSYKASQFDSRIKACVLIEGILAFGEEQLFEKPIPALITYNTVEEDLVLLPEIQQDMINISNRVNNSIMIVHAETDKLIPFSIAQNLYDTINNDKRLLAYKEKTCYDNYLINHYNTVLDNLDDCISEACDWLKDKL